MMKKILLVLGILILVILAAAIILPVIYKDEIAAKVKDGINKNINVKVEFADFDLSLIRSFPDFTISLDKLSVVGVEEFSGDTLTAADELSVTVDIMSVIRGGKIDVNSVKLTRPLVNLIVLQDGKANWDIAKEDTSAADGDTSSTEFSVALKKYSITDGDIRYNDLQGGMKMELLDLDHSGNGDFTQDIFELNTNTDIASANFWYGGVKYLHEVKAALKADLDMNMPQMKFTFKENELNLNELILGFDGFVAMPGDDISMDIKFEARKNEFRNFLSMVPGVYRDGFKDLKSSGSLAFKGFVKGIYNEKRMPGFGVDLQVQNGNFQYASLPVGVSNVQINLSAKNPDGDPDHTAIDLTKMHVQVGSDPFDAVLSVRTPVSDPQLDGMVKGRVNFANLNKIIPLEKGTTLNGMLVSDVNFKGRMSAIEQKRYQDFNAAGNIDLTGFRYVTAEDPQGIDMSECRLTFNPQNVTLNSLKARIGSSDFNANGSIDNLLAYFVKDEVIRGTLNLQSNKINLADFQSEEGTADSAPADTASMQLVEVPANLDFVMNTAINTLVYDNVTLQSVAGKVIIRNKTVNMENLSFNTLGGSMRMSGTYATPERKKADMKFNMNITGFDIQQTVKTFATVQKMAPIAERANGSFSSNLTFNGQLDEHMDPILPSLNGQGKLTTAGVTITNFPPLVKLSDALKMDQFRKLDVNNVNVSFKFENGRVNVEPFDLALGGIPANIAGSTGFDQTIDYTIGLNLPTSKLPSQATGVLNGLISQANSKGANFSMSETIKVNALIGGTVSNPTVSTGIKETAGNLVKDVKEQVKDLVDEKKQELENKAREEAERLRKEAEDKANAEKERLRKEAEAKAKAESDRLKKEAEQKAKDALKNVFGQPKK